MNIKNIIIYGLLLVCIILIIFRPSPKPINNLNQKYIDSIVVLKQQQKQYDSIISYYRQEIDILDDKLDNTNQNQVKTRIIYKDRIIEVNNYQPSQLDSFFKQRYK